MSMMSTLPPRRKSPQLAAQLNKLVTTYDEIQVAEIKGDAREGLRLVADGLANSCVVSVACSSARP